MTSKEWEKYIRSLAKVSRPDDMELRLLADLAAAESLAYDETGRSWKDRALAAEKETRCRITEEQRQGLIAKISTAEMALERSADATQFYADKAKAAEAALRRIRDDLSGYCSHEYPCLLAQWHEGRPTSDGGYKTRYGDQWYQRGDKPPCTCGLSAILEAKP